MIYEATRPIWGKAKPPFRGEVKVPIGREISHIGGDTYQILVIHVKDLSPPTMGARHVQFTINSHIANSDLRAKA